MKGTQRGDENAETVWLCALTQCGREPDVLADRVATAGDLHQSGRRIQLATGQRADDGGDGRLDFSHSICPSPADQAAGPSRQRRYRREHGASIVARTRPGRHQRLPLAVGAAHDF